MSITVIVIILILIAVIMFLNGKWSFRRKSREQYLKELAHYLEGELQPLDDPSYPNAYRITFRFAKRDFVYEDYEKEGFKDKVYIAYLRLATAGNFRLTFSEKKRSTKIRTDIFIASEIMTQNIGHNIQLNVPKILSDVTVTTNDTRLANKFLAVHKVLNILRHYKQIDSRGYAYLPVGILDGVITMEFYSDQSLHPNLSDIYGDIASIENHLERIINLARQLESLGTSIN